MARRSYKQAWSLARALDAVGDRWTLLVIRDLLLGPRRYGQLQACLPGIGTNLLADRLKSMEKIGLVRRRPVDAGHQWELTEIGLGLEPALMAMIRWAMATRLPAHGDELSRPEWDLIAMKALFDPHRYTGAPGRFRLVLNGLAGILEIVGEALHVRQEDGGAARATIEMDATTGWQLATARAGFEDALADGRLKVSGDTGAARRLLEAFRLGK
ncbi:MAG: winged helix-turn-helix transcriptional regulator [Gammaproteobacteria bacterium]|nr:MAG: winged helix-turn-helix transcriptional regulator [Gammaproteobacteria bacterium]